MLPIEILTHIPNRHLSSAWMFYLAPYWRNAHLLQTARRIETVLVAISAICDTLSAFRLKILSNSIQWRCCWTNVIVISLGRTRAAFDRYVCTRSVRGDRCQLTRARYVGRHTEEVCVINMGPNKGPRPAGIAGDGTLGGPLFQLTDTDRYMI